MEKSVKPEYLKLVLCIFLCLSAGFIGSFFTAPAIPGWYASLVKPAFNPPSFVFAPVWTILYILMGISLWMIIREGMDNPKVRTAVILFGVQFLLNIIWSPVFFGLKAPSAAFLIIFVLWWAILANMISFYKIKKQAGLILLPYLLWVSFASILNYAIWRLNG
ncbi:MAG: tryptophan-rich sensory protein [Firmicutes bacterium]|nr:tryptophan-rich sensory protein [Bacillota bacterium]